MALHRVNTPSQLHTITQEEDSRKAPAGPGLLTTVAEKLGLSQANALPSSIELSNEDRKNLAIGPMDLVGGFLARSAVPLLASLNPAGAVMALLGVGLMNKSSKTRGSLARRISEDSVVRLASDESRRGVQREEGFRIVEASKLQNSRLDEIDRTHKGIMQQVLLSAQESAKQGNLDNETRVKVAEIQSRATEIANITNNLRHLFDQFAELKTALAQDPQGSREAIEANIANQARWQARLDMLLRKGTPEEKELANKYKEALGKTEQALGGSSNVLGTYNRETGRIE